MVIYRAIQPDEQAITDKKNTPDANRPLALEWLRLRVALHQEITEVGKKMIIGQHDRIRPELQSH